MKKARAISAVVRPTTARRVSATWAGRGQGGVAAPEDQREPLVLPLGRRRRGLVDPAGQDLQLVPVAGLAPKSIKRVVPSRGEEPAAGSVRDAVATPGLQRLDDRLGHRLLGDVEVAEDAVERRDQVRRLVADDPLERGVRALRCRSSAAVVDDRPDLDRDAGERQ